MLIDTHCHLNIKEYPNLNQIISSLESNDVKAIIISGCDVASSNEAIELANKYDNVYATVGFHPSECNTISNTDYKMFNKWMINENVIGIGEIGIDYHYGTDDKAKQMIMFKKQIDIAVKYNKPIIVHSRDANEDVYNILKDSAAKGIIHCFDGDYDMAKNFINLGFFLGVGGIITFKNNNIKNVIQNISLDHLVLETDSPYLAPEPFRGKQNNPLYLYLVAESLSKIKNSEYNEVASITTHNVNRLFDFK